MDISFATSRLALAGQSLPLARRIFGTVIGQKYFDRLSTIRSASKFDGLFMVHALRLHPLEGNRSGQYAMTITGNFGLIVEPLSDERLRILSVEDYHGK